jgi:argininosuccinate lyase
MSMDILLFSMSEFGFIEIPSELCTGSSIMPNKKNFDVLELIRANYHKNVGFEFEVKNIIGNLISGYNRDLQLTKNPTINAIDITKDSLEVMNQVLKKLNINKQKCKKAMTEDLYATEEVYNLIKKGVTFRDAYKKIGEGF